MLSPDDTEATADIKERNLFEISMNDLDQIMVNGEVIQIQQLRKKVVAFIDNGGLPIQSSGYCDYCQGEGSITLSENPSKAIISIKAQRNTSYPVYVAVQNEVLGAYNDLRNRASLRLFNSTFKAMELAYYAVETRQEQKSQLKKNIERIRELYPQKILEPETINN